MRNFQILVIVVGILFKTNILSASGSFDYYGGPSYSLPHFDVLYCQSQPKKEESPELKAREALAAKSYEEAITLSQGVIEQYEAKAKEMQASLTEFPWETKEKIFQYWPLATVALAYTIQGVADWELGKKDKAQELFTKVNKELWYAQCWDPQGLFQKVGEGTGIYRSLLQQNETLESDREKERALRGGPPPNPQLNGL